MRTRFSVRKRRRRCALPAQSKTCSRLGSVFGWDVLVKRKRDYLVGRVTPCAPGYLLAASGAHGVTRPTRHHCIIWRPVPPDFNHTRRPPLPGSILAFTADNVLGSAHEQHR